MADFDPAEDARDGTIELVSAYASNSNNRLTPEEFQSLIKSTFDTLSSLSAPVGDGAEPTDEPKSKAEVRKSIGATHLISFIDNRPYKSLKRHLTTNGMTPAEYRAKFGLDASYPMTHPAYSAARSALAKSIGLGLQGRSAKAGAPAPTPAAAAPKLNKPKNAKPKAEGAPKLATPARSKAKAEPTTAE